MDKKGFNKVRMDEQELISRIQEGDEVAFAEIVNRYKDRIVNYLFQLTGDYQRAVDLSQETFMRVYFKAKKYRPIAPFSSWIYTIATNLAKTDMRKMQRYSTISLDAVNDNYKSGAFDKNPSDLSMLALQVRKALNTLHPRYKIPVILKDMEGFSLEEIAQVLKSPVGTIKARVSRGRSYLKKAMEKVLQDKESYPVKKEISNGRA